jgi:Tfp pilus assembly protein PilF
MMLLKSTAYAAAGDYVNAIAQCDAALKREPKNLRVQIRMAELQREATR